jgi:hypothetical protein
MENKPQKIFANPLSWRSRSDNQPDFIRGSLSVNVRDMVDFMQNPENMEYISPKGYMNFQLLRSKDGSKMYFTLDTYKPKKEYPETIDEVKAIETVPFTEEEKQALENRQREDAETKKQWSEPSDDLSNIPF